jgi:hypothetical protein
MLYMFDHVTTKSLVLYLISRYWLEISKNKLQHSNEKKQICINHDLPKDQCLHVITYEPSIIRSNALPSKRSIAYSIIACFLFVH